jgi:hypothetical protein
MGDLFIWFPILIIISLGLAGLIFTLIEANDKIERITKTDDNVLEFPSRDLDGGDVA